MKEKKILLNREISTFSRQLSRDSKFISSFASLLDPSAVTSFIQLHIFQNDFLRSKGKNTLSPELGVTQSAPRVIA